MRTILLSYLLFLGISAHAQIYTANGFQSSSPETGDQRGWVYKLEVPDSLPHDWGYNYGYRFANCNPSHDNVYYGGQIKHNSGHIEAIYTPTEIGNGEAITCSVNFLKSTAQDSKGIISFRYSTDRGVTWTALGIAHNISPTCQTKTEIIPAGIVTAANSAEFRFMVKVTRLYEARKITPTYFIDDIKLIQKVLVAPSCPNLTAPAKNARNTSVRPVFNWGLATGAYDYKLSIGTTPGGTDILNNANVSSGYTPNLNKIYSPNTKYYVKLIATNPISDSKECAETAFTTGDNPFAPYCGPMLSSAFNLIAPITSVNIAGTTYTSDTTATTLGAFEPHQSFVDKVFTVKNNATTVPITIKAIGTELEGWAMSVFIDWNNDGNFDGAGEAYFTTDASMVRSTTIDLENTVTLTANLTIPAGTPLGKKRTRVKYSNSNTSINDGLVKACTELSKGQVEDYTISYEKYLPVSDVDKKNISVYPNPFKDILKISEVKDAKSITVADASGKVVATPKVSQELNLSHLSKGVYFITVSYHNGPTKLFKVIKE